VKMTSTEVLTTMIIFTCDDCDDDDEKEEWVRWMQAHRDWEWGHSFTKPRDVWGPTVTEKCFCYTVFAKLIVWIGLTSVVNYSMTICQWIWLFLEWMDVFSTRGGHKVFSPNILYLITIFSTIYISVKSASFTDSYEFAADMTSL